MGGAESLQDMAAALDFLKKSDAATLAILGFYMRGLALLELTHDEQLRTGVISHGDNFMVASEKSLLSLLVKHIALVRRSSESSTKKTRTQAQRTTPRSSNALKILALSTISSRMQQLVTHL